MSGKRPFDVRPNLFAGALVAVGDASCDFLTHEGETSACFEFVGRDGGVSRLPSGGGNESSTIFGGSENHVSDFAGDAQNFRAESYFSHNDFSF